MDVTTKKKPILIALAVSYIFATLSVTIISPALPSIIGELDGMAYYSWISTIYATVAAVTTILVGRPSDIFGRRVFLLGGLVFYLGAALCAGICQNVTEFIIARAFQGVGGGIITSCAFSAVGDLYAERERIKWQGMLNGTYGVAALFGPTLGGFITDYLNWRWIFFIFLPVGAIAFVMLLTMFPKKRERNTKEKIDYPGSAALAAVMLTIMVWFNSVGSAFSFVSLPSFALIAVAAGAMAFFIRTEKRAVTPVLPLDLFSNQRYTTSCVVSFLNGVALFTTSYYISLFVQSVMSSSATQAGLVCTPLSMVMMLVSAATGNIVARTGRYKALLMAGLVSITLSFSLYSLMNTGTSLLYVGAANLLTGVGLGLCLPIVMLITQSAAPRNLLGVATASFKTFRQLGGTIGLAVMSIIMSTGFSNGLAKLRDSSGVMRELLDNEKTAAAVAGISDPDLLMDRAAIANILSGLPAALQEKFSILIHELRVMFGHAMQTVFLTGVAFALLALAIGFTIRELELKRTQDEPMNGKEAP
jgi:EmrB/QacA subfamily drug resistance transporter